MIFQQSLSFPVYPVPTLDILDERNAPTLHFSVACDQCGRLLPRPAVSVAQGVALALADGWSIKIADGFKLEGLFSAEDLTGANVETFCFRCGAEFEP